MPRCWAQTCGAPFLTADYNAWFAAHPLTGILDVGTHVLLPALTIAIVGIAGDSRFVRASMLDTIHQDYIRTAKAKGMSNRVVVLKHALRNALLPVITNIALNLPGLFSGAVVTEALDVITSGQPIAVMDKPYCVFRNFGNQKRKNHQMGSVIDFAITNAHVCRYLINRAHGTLISGSGGSA